MRSHDPTHGCSRRRVWLALLFVIAAPCPRARADDAQTAAPSEEPYALVADHVYFWRDGERQVVLLEGRAAIIQGVDGLRADKAVVSIDDVRTSGIESKRLAIYAEGDVRPADDSARNTATGRFVRLTRGPISVRQHGPGQPLAVPRPERPTGFLARAFPPAPAPRPPARPQPPVRARDLRETSLVNAAPPEVPTPPPKTPAPRAAAQPDAQPSAALPAAEVLPAAAPPAELAPGPAPSPVVADRPLVDPAAKPAQFEAGFPEIPGASPPSDVIENPPPAPRTARQDADAEDMQVVEEPVEPVPALPSSEMPRRVVPDENPSPVLPGTRRIVTISPRDSGSNYTIQQFQKDGEIVTVIRGGVNIVAQIRARKPGDPDRGTVDVSADNAVIWTKQKTQQSSQMVMEADASEPLEVYFEGNVVFLQDARKFAGTADQKRIEAPRFYYDFKSEWALADHAEFGFFAPGLLSPLRVQGANVKQYRKPLVANPKNDKDFGPTEIFADSTLTTGSRFPEPGYKFTNSSIYMVEKNKPLNDPLTGSTAGNPNSPNTPQEQVWRITARNNFYSLGPVPVFYWPRITMDSDDFDEFVLNNIMPRFDKIFGQQLLTDWNMFRVLGIPRPTMFDRWNFDVDYLSYRTKEFPALGSEIGWFGKDIIGDILDPYHKNRNRPDTNYQYYGYLDLWGLKDLGVDDIGLGPAVILDGPPTFAKTGNENIRNGNGQLNIPVFTQFRGRAVARHMQSLIDTNVAAPDEDMRLQLEVGKVSDRNFELQYYKTLFNAGTDQETLAYWIDQKQNRAMSVLTEANLQYWYTETQWAPKFDYYRLGDNLFREALQDAGIGDYVSFNYSEDSGADYANTHTSREVNNPALFAYLPYDPVSNTRGTLNTGRIWTSHEIDAPINLGFLRLVPYAQGQFVYWNHQIGGNQIGRVWGGVGGRADVMMWRAFPNVDSELLNLHGLAHKVNFQADFRTAVANSHLNQIGVQDDIDSNSYELVRRYFTMTNFVGGVLPLQYDPRYLMLRRTISPITGTTDLQDTMETLQLAVRQRLQTKRGPEGKRRVIDWMTLDVMSTYFPDARRDNFGVPFGQNQYNWEWYVGDRTSIFSNGWFEFWRIGGVPTVPSSVNNPFSTGLRVVNSGITIARPPRGNISLSYMVINSGPMNTSALNTSFSYWLSPKWYGSLQNSYDFGHNQWLGSSLGMTKITADFMISIGIALQPLQRNYQFMFELTPRISPSVRLGSGGGAARFDQRFAPTQ